MFIELTMMDGTSDYVNVNYIKRIHESDMQGVGSVIEFSHAPIWNNNPTDFCNSYKETYDEIKNMIYYVLYEEGRVSS
jgi:hypothetical protein